MKDSVPERIERKMSHRDDVLFMKGTPVFARCRFSKVMQLPCHIGDCVARMGHANAVTPTSPGFMQSGHSSDVRVLASGSGRQQRWRLRWPRSRQYAIVAYR